MPKSVSKYVTEFRYRALPEVLDIRGKLAKVTVTSELTEWRIGQDRIDTFNVSQTQALFLSYQNCGFAFEGGDNKAFDGLMEALQRAVKLLPDASYLRFGVRRTTYLETTKSFEQLLTDFQQRLMQNKFLDAAPQKTTVKDVALVYDLLVGGDLVSLYIGPMKNEQAKMFFPKAENLPKSGIFIDIDVHKIPVAGSTFKDVKRFAFFARQKAEEMNRYMANLLKGTGGEE